jgi:vitamin B12/bleomycin/antimicrobial peptide transport system ATP-binding/permease protein
MSSDRSHHGEGQYDERNMTPRVRRRPPDIIIMDEPTSVLDDLSQTRQMELLSEEAPGSTIIHAARRNVDKRFYDREIRLKVRPRFKAQRGARFSTGAAN